MFQNLYRSAMVFMPFFASGTERVLFWGSIKRVKSLQGEFATGVSFASISMTCPG